MQFTGVLVVFFVVCMVHGRRHRHKVIDSSSEINNDVHDDSFTETRKFTWNPTSNIRVGNRMGYFGSVDVKIYTDELMVADERLRVGQNLEFGFNPRPNGSSFYINVTWCQDKTWNIMANLYDNSEIGDFGFWIRGDALYQGEYEGDSDNVSVIEKWIKDDIVQT